MRITLLPHALEQMVGREIPEDRVQAALEEPDVEYPGNAGRTVAERTFEGESLAVKVIYNMGLEGERVVVSVMRGRSKYTQGGGP